MYRRSRSLLDNKGYVQTFSFYQETHWQCTDVLFFSPRGKMVFQVKTNCNQVEFTARRVFPRRMNVCTLFHSLNPTGEQKEWNCREKLLCFLKTRVSDVGGSCSLPSHKPGREELLPACHSRSSIVKSRQEICSVAPVLWETRHMEQPMLFPRPGTHQSWEDMRSNGDRAIVDWTFPRIFSSSGNFSRLGMYICIWPKVEQPVKWNGIVWLHHTMKNFTRAESRERKSLSWNDAPCLATGNIAKSKDRVK